MAGPGRSKALTYVGALVAVLAVILVIIYLTTEILHLLPLRYARFENAFIVGVVVYFIFRIIKRFIETYLSRFTERSSLHPVIFFVSVLGYIVLGLAVTATLGINVSSVIIGGSLVSIVIGLASQTVLSNQFAGIMITVVRPFRIGDYVTINTWQYGGTFPVLYPKYFSVDRIEASAYGGIVEDVTINYTSLRLDNGDLVKVPNGVVVQAAIISRKGKIRVKARYEIPKYIAPERVREALIPEIRKIQEIEGEPEIAVDEVTLNTYVLMITATFNNTEIDLNRSRILSTMMTTVEPMKVS